MQPSSPSRRISSAYAALEIRPELLGVRVHRRVDGSRAAPVVHHARRGNREFGNGADDHGLQELKVVGEDRVWQADAIGDTEGCRREGDRPFGISELHLELLVCLGDPAEPVDEIHVPGTAPELAVGRRGKADVLLHRHHRPDGVVLRGRQGIRGNPARGVIGPSREQRGGTEQAADVVGSERRRGALRHRADRTTGDRRQLTTRSAICQMATCLPAATGAPSSPSQATSSPAK